MDTKAIWRAVLALFLGAATLTAGAQPSPVPPARHPAGAPSASEREWWKNAVIYEIYPRSF